MKPFLLFAGLSFYPRGGWGDYIGGGDNMEEALALLPSDADWHHVVHDDTIVEEGTR